jgi:hypothetical protein
MGSQAGKRQTSNIENQMTKEARMSKSEWPFDAIHASDFVILSSFGFRHSNKPDLRLAGRPDLRLSKLQAPMIIGACDRG